MNARVLAALTGLLCSVCAMSGQVDTPDIASEHAERGVQSAQAGDLVRAEAELRRAVELAPENASYLTSLGGILGMEQKLEEANVYFERAVKCDPADPTPRRNLAANQWRLGQLNQAQANLERLLRAQPQDKVATLLLGMVSENEKNYARAAKLLATVPELVEQRPESVAALANSYYQTGRRERAHDLLEGLLGRPASSQGIYAAAGVAAQARDYGIAEKLFESIQSSYPDKEALEYNLALIQFRTERVAESQKTLLDLVNTGRAKSAAYNLLGWCYAKENKPGEAVHAIENAIRLDPSNESNYLDLTTILMDNHRLVAALEVARKAVEAFPQSGAAYRAKGMVEMKMDQFTDAVRSYGQAVGLEPKSVDAKVGLASANWGAGKRAQAEAQFQSLLKEHPSDATAYESYGSSLLNGATDAAMLGRAAALLKKAVELDSSRAEPHYQLGILELKKSAADVSPDSMRQALAELQNAVKLGLSDSRVHYALARVYRRLGRENEAASEMQLYKELKATEENPGQTPGGT
ncbi:MAG: tetratricopeptide repeat protein [Acidobacteriaceae bacterium]|nr:tetratricopeptide repeat protein [Acidobacteriaceae bacterium]MBV9499862.1 tetratricopeptide repeat protein [Acidobacteriaceae bacterium]